VAHRSESDAIFMFRLEVVFMFRLEVVKVNFDIKEEKNCGKMLLKKGPMNIFSRCVFQMYPLSDI
jgi:hypothetical protein